MSHQATQEKVFVKVTELKKLSRPQLCPLWGQKICIKISVPERQQGGHMDFSRRPSWPRGVDKVGRHSVWPMVCALVLAPFFRMLFNGTNRLKI